MVGRRCACPTKGKSREAAHRRAKRPPLIVRAFAPFAQKWNDCFSTAGIEEMSAEIKKEIHLEIGHVLFIDIAAYSDLLIN